MSESLQLQDRCPLPLGGYLSDSAAKPLRGSFFWHIQSNVRSLEQPYCWHVCDIGATGLDGKSPTE